MRRKLNRVLSQVQLDVSYRTYSNARTGRRQAGGFKKPRASLLAVSLAGCLAASGFSRSTGRNLVLITAATPEPFSAARSQAFESGIELTFRPQTRSTLTWSKLPRLFSIFKFQFSVSVFCFLFSALRHLCPRGVWDAMMVYLVVVL